MSIGRIIAPGGETVLACMVCGAALGFCVSKLTFLRSHQSRFLLFHVAILADFIAANIL
jgi:hypothetical protein